jgi:hypothetical protein
LRIEELAHLEPGNSQEFLSAVDVDSALAERGRRIEVVEERRDARRAGKKPRQGALGRCAVALTKGQIAVRVEKDLAVALTEEPEGELQVDLDRRIIVDGDLLAPSFDDTAAEATSRNTGLLGVPSSLTIATSATLVTSGPAGRAAVTPENLRSFCS